MSAVGMNSQNVAAAMDWCRNLCRVRARNFYYGLKLSPEPQRSALYAIYAWMRMADDLVDELPHSHTATAEELETFRRRTIAALSGTPSDTSPLWTALASVASQFDLMHEPFHDMLEGQLEDLQHNEYETFDELRKYCQRVASSVGMLCIQVWGCNDVHSQQLAIDRGIAFQLTNIIRDFKQDYDSGRVYFPREDLQRFGVSAADLRAWARPTECLALVKQQIDRARRYYDNSAELDEIVAAPFRPTLCAMTEIYRGLLEKMDRAPQSIVAMSRVRLSAWHKATIAVRAKWRARGVRHHEPVAATAPVRTASRSSTSR